MPSMQRFLGLVVIGLTLGASMFVAGFLYATSMHAGGSTGVSYQPSSSPSAAARVGKPVRPHGAGASPPQAAFTGTEPDTGAWGDFDSLAKLVPPPAPQQVPADAESRDEAIGGLRGAGPRARTETPRPAMAVGSAAGSAAVARGDDEDSGVETSSSRDGQAEGGSTSDTTGVSATSGDGSSGGSSDGSSSEPVDAGSATAFDTEGSDASDTDADTAVAPVAVDADSADPIGGGKFKWPAVVRPLPARCKASGGAKGGRGFAAVVADDVAAWTPLDPVPVASYAELRASLGGPCPASVTKHARTAMAAWVKLHHDMVTGRTPMRALRYVCMKHCGGTADRLKGIIFAFWTAFLSNRAFFIDYRVPFPLEDIIAPNAIDWRVSKQGTAAQHNRMPAVDKWKVYKLMNVDRVREKQYELYSTLAAGLGDDLVAVRTNLVLVDYMMHVKPRADPARFKALQDLRLSVQVAMETLFRPRAALRARVAKFVAATPDLWRRRPAVPMLCMHCRTFVADKKPSKYSAKTYDLYIKAGMDLLKRMLGTAYSEDTQAAVYVASDDPASMKALAKAQKRAGLSQLQFVQLKMPVFHVGVIGTKAKKDKQMALDYTLNVQAEHFLLSTCDGLVMWTSGFSEIAAMWDGLPVSRMAVVTAKSKRGPHEIVDPRSTNHFFSRRSPRIPWPTDDDWDQQQP